MRRLAAYCRYLRDERGVETLEWIVVGGLIAGVAVAVYQTEMKTGLQEAITTIINKVKAAVL
jgi:Flp pilus assembly pilin Flp